MTLIAGRNNVGKSGLLRALRYTVAAEPGAAPDLALSYAWSDSFRRVRTFLQPPHVEPFRKLVEGYGGDDAQLDVRAELAVGSGQPAGRSDMTGGMIGRGGPQNLEYRGVTLAVDGSELIHLVIRERTQDNSWYLWWDDADPWTQTRFQLAEGLLQVVANALARIYFAAPRRSTARMHLAPTTQLTADGSNLTAVIATLFVNERHGRFAQLEAFARDVFPEINHIEVPIEGNPPQAEVFLTIGRHGGFRAPLGQSGTGVEQALMLATGVLTSSSTGFLFLVDEPHAFLHPAAERRVLQFIRSHDEHQYVVATHSPGFLNAFPASNTRIVTIHDDGSHVADIAATSALLTELGVTAADLWTSNAILWVEGDSDVAICRVIAERLLRDLIAVLPMPDRLRAAVRTVSNAKGEAELCAAIAKAATPIRIRMTYLYDVDERRKEVRDQLIRVTAGAARFLNVREIENYLLSADALSRDASALCALLGLPQPTLSDMASSLNDILAETESRELYPDGAMAPDAQRVVGSEVLRRLYWLWTKSEYDKVRDGERLARHVVDLHPERFEPILDIMRELAVATTSAPDAT